MPKSKKVMVGTRTVRVLNMPEASLQDLYHYGLSCGWGVFVAASLGAFCALNAVFATIYWALPAGEVSIPEGDWLRAFFFSVETFSTVGYGAMHPDGVIGHAVASAEMFAGILCTALITGLIFARFSAPKPRLMFAKNMVVCRTGGKMFLMVRVANARRSVIVDARAKLRLIRTGRGSDGREARRVEDLRLVKGERPLFVIGWTMAHEITADSPLHGESGESLANATAALVLTVSGHDETISQTLVGKHAYAAGDVRWNSRYAALSKRGADGSETMDYSVFDDTEPDEGGQQDEDEDGSDPTGERPTGLAG